MSILISANETISDNQNHLDDEYGIQYLAVMLFLGVLMIVGTVANCLMFLVYLIKVKPSTTRCFILALSIIDLITCSICIPIDIVILTYSFSFTTFWLISCKLAVVVNFTALASAGILISVATERFKKICRPFGPQITVKTAKFAVLLSCIAAVIGSMPAFILQGENTDLIEDGNITNIDTFCRMSDKNGTISGFAFGFAGFVAITSTLITLYFLIWRRVTCFAEDNHLSMESNTSIVTTSPVPKRDENRTEITRHCKRQLTARRTTLMFFTITFTFILSYLPTLSSKAVRLAHWKSIEDLSGRASAFYLVFDRFYFINFAVDPFIYGYFDKNVRNNIKALFSFKRCRKRNMLQVEGTLAAHSDSNQK